MAFYFSTKKIPQLSGYSFVERAAIMAAAQEAMPVPRRLICNLAKLVPICVVFYAIVDVPGWWKLPALLAAGIGYPLFTQPININMSLPYIEKAIRQFEASRAES